MTDREIMQQALNALEYHTKHTYPFHQTNVAMEALRQALAQPEPFKPDWVSYRQGVADGAAQHEQESPHSAKHSADSAEGFGKPDIGLPDPCPQCRKGGVCRTPKCGRLKLPAEHSYRNQALAQPEQEPKLSDAGVDTNIPLWGLEPKGKGMVTLHERQWVGLTEDEIKKIMQRWRGEFDIRDIERLLKEKNT